MPRNLVGDLPSSSSSSTCASVSAVALTEGLPTARFEVEAALLEQGDDRAETRVGVEGCRDILASPISPLSHFVPLRAASLMAGRAVDWPLVSTGCGDALGAVDAIVFRVWEVGDWALASSSLRRLLEAGVEAATVACLLRPDGGSIKASAY